MRAESIDVEQWRVLVFLASGNGLAMGELSSGLALGSSTTTKVIDRLVSNALVYRAPDAVDRRKTLIFISEFGLQTLARVHPAIAVAEQEMGRRIGKKAELDRFAEIAVKFAEGE